MPTVKIVGNSQRHFLGLSYLERLGKHGIESRQARTEVPRAAGLVPNMVDLVGGIQKLRGPQRAQRLHHGFQESQSLASDHVVDSESGRALMVGVGGSPPQQPGGRLVVPPLPQGRPTFDQNAAGGPPGQRNHLRYFDVLVEHFRVAAGTDQSVHHPLRNPVGYLEAHGLPGPGVGRDSHVDPLAAALFPLGLPGNGLQIPQPLGEQGRALAHLAVAADGKHLRVHLHPVGRISGEELLEDAQTLFPHFRMDKVESDRGDIAGSRVFILAHPKMVAVEHEVGEPTGASGLLGSPGPDVEVSAGKEQHPLFMAAVAEQLGTVPTLPHQLAHMQAVPIVHRMVPFAHVAPMHLSDLGVVNAHPTPGGQLKNEGVHRGSGHQVHRLGHIRLGQGRRDPRHVVKILPQEHARLVRRRIVRLPPGRQASCD